MLRNLGSFISASLKRQRAVSAGTIVLTPVDSVPVYLDSEHLADHLQGYYVTDKLRAARSLKDAKILFGRRGRAIYDTREIYNAWANALQAESVSLRLLSGLHAHVTVFMGLGNIGDTVMILPEEAGGHFSTAEILERLGYHTIHMIVDYRSRRIDVGATRQVINDERPDLLLIARSEGLNYEDFTPIIRDSGAYTVFDASHYLPGILYGRYEHPFDMGADLILSSLHKSFPGPQKALVAAKRETDERWKRVLNGIGSYVSSTHIKTTYLAGMALGYGHILERYTDESIRNAVSLEQLLLDRGIPVVQRHQCEPPTTHLWIRAHDRLKAFEWYRGLAYVRISTNYRLLPYNLGVGLRLGTGVATLMGLKQEHLPELADIIAAALGSGASRDLRHRVRALCDEMARFSMLNNQESSNRGA